MNDSFATSLVLVLDQLYNVKELWSARAKLTHFAIDVCLVAHGVRSGHLIDTLSPPNPERMYTSLLTALRAQNAVFEHVVCWHHAPTTQSFLVHAQLLEARLDAVLRGTGECMFIKLGERVSVARELLGGLQEALQGMKRSMIECPDALVLSLSDAFTEEVLIPLAAVVIDYPVAYVPAYPAQTSFLEREPLDIYTVALQETAPSVVGKEHVLLKFSCPQVLASNHPELSPGRVLEKLRAKFLTRLGRIGMQMLASHHTETLDRVAL